VKDENDDPLAYFHSILNWWNKYFSQLLNVHNISDVMQIEVHTSEHLVPGTGRLEDFFFLLNPLLFANCTNTFSKCCEITTTTDMKRSAQ
jgi:hypothetical protein